VDLALRHTPERLREEHNPDFLTGAAGSIAVLAWLHRRTSEPQLLQRARVLAETVRACAVEGGRTGWQVPGFHRPLLGMAHGSAGIAMALLRLYRETGDEWMREFARAGLAHERAHFQPDDRQWPNLQERGERVSFMTGWCAGAAGVGLARLATRELLPDDPAIPEEIAAAVEATRGHLGGYQHHLCCGESGRIVFLHAAGQTAEARDAALRMAELSRSLGYWRLQEFSESMPIPGLTNGVAGVGLALISFIHPSRSEVLTLS
jgi:lantibiotic modifying enzyme